MVSGDLACPATEHFVISSPIVLVTYCQCQCRGARSPPGCGGVEVTTRRALVPPLCDVVRMPIATRGHSRRFIHF
jgi:hypothetical protein